MATTLNELNHVKGDGFGIYHVKMTAGAADTTVTTTLPIGLKVMGGGAVKTTGTIGGQGVTYVSSTGVLTVQCGNNDVVEVSLIVSS